MSADDKFLNKLEKAAPVARRKKLGEILVEKGILTPLTVERVLTLSQRSGIKFGSILEEIGLVTGEELSAALALQFNYRTVANFAASRFEQKLLDLVPAETAVTHTVFPLKVQGNTLALAMADPTCEQVLANLRQNTQMQIYPVIATRHEVRTAIARHYFQKELVDLETNTIMVVDDDSFVTDQVSAILQKEGYKVVPVQDALEAFRVILTSRPKLILTDKEMPKFNGYNLLESLRTIPETRAIPVILVSGSTNPNEEARAYEKGFADYIGKPLVEWSLKAKVKRAITNQNHLSVLSGGSRLAC
jgi:CheY-like chemotaxis protein